MSDAILVALLSLAGTIIGSVIGVLSANKLIVYRLEQLEKRLDQMYAFNERVYKVESDMATCFGKYDALLTRVNSIDK